MTLESTSAETSGTEVGPPVPFDRECAEALASVAEFIPPSLTPEMIPLLRQPNPAMPAPTNEDLQRGGAFTVEERSVGGPEGAPDVPLLICRPTSATTPLPVIYYIHGGGMIIGDNRNGILEMLDLAQDLEISVVSVDYRLAPETPHPGPIEDCYAGLLWTVENAKDLGIDPGRVIVAGASAGGGLAAALALLARDRGGPALAGQVLIYPMLDDRNDSVSARQMAGLGIWDRISNETGWTALLGDARGGPEVSPYAAPARATDLSGLPPAFIDVASAETFRDEDVAYATRIWQAGGVAELHVWPGGYHGFDGFAPEARISKEATAARLHWLRRLLSP